MPFKDPGTGGDKLPLDELEGCLLLVDVHEQMDEMQTMHGPATPIRADVAVLDGPRKAERFDDTLVFPRFLVSQLRSSIGEQVLGRLGKGKAQAGKNAPWQLSPASAEDRAVAERYAAHYAATVAAKAVTDEEPF